MTRRRPRSEAAELELAARKNLETQICDYRKTIKGLERQLAMRTGALEHVESLEHELEFMAGALFGLSLPRPPARERLPDDREGEAWDLRIGPKETGVSCTVHLGFFPDGRLGEIFLRLDKRNRFAAGGAMADAACTFLSIALQYGAPLKPLVDKLVGAADSSGGITRIRVDPSKDEFVADPDVPQCQSLRDYLGKKLRARFYPEEPAG